MRIGGCHDQGTGTAHLLVEQPDGIERGVIPAEGIGTYELGKTGGFMRIGRDNGPHFMDDDRHGAHYRLPGRFRAGKAAAYDVDGFEHDAILHQQSTESDSGYTRICKKG